VVQPDERITLYRHSPFGGIADIRPEPLAVNPHCRVPQRGYREPTERRPEQRNWRKIFLDKVSSRGAQTVADQHRGPRPHPATEEKVESSAIWKRRAHGTVAACRDVAFLVFPFERYLSMAFREAESRQCAVRRGDSSERRQRA